MTKLLKKEYQGVIAQLCSLDVKMCKPSIFVDLQKVLDNHSKVFEDIPKVIPPTQDHDHSIHLILGSVPPNIRPYIYPYAQKIEIDLMVEEILKVGVIQPIQISFSSPMVLVYKKEVSMAFITTLPKSKSKKFIMVVFDRLTKYAYFCTLSHPVKISIVVEAFIEII